MINPLFVPLISKYYEAFKDGSKTVEYRLHGKRWHCGTCYKGRPVTLSKGYGKKNRLNGVIDTVDILPHYFLTPENQEVIKDIYGEGDHQIICITIKLNFNKGVG